MKNYIARGATPLLLVLALFISACKKNDMSEVVSGQVKEIGTEKPISNAKVYSIECKGGLFEPNSCIRTSATITDQEGRYFLHREPEYVMASAPRYWDSEFIPILYCKENRTDIVLTPHAWLRVKIKNESGAYGFGYSSHLYTQTIGLDTTIVNICYGNTPQKFIFYVEISPGQSPNDPSLASAHDENNQIIEVKKSGSLYLDFNPLAHDTMDITIIY